MRNELMYVGDNILLPYYDLNDYHIPSLPIFVFANYACACSFGAIAIPPRHYLVTNVIKMKFEGASTTTSEDQLLLVQPPH